MRFSSRACIRYARATALSLAQRKATCRQFAQCRVAGLSHHVMSDAFLLVMGKPERQCMTTYENLLKAVIRYFEKHGKTQATCDKLETMLPGAWCANLIADALDILAAK